MVSAPKRRVRRDERPRGSYIFAVRCKDDTLQRQLAKAAIDDNMTIPELLECLLKLKENWAQLTTPAHPLGLPVPYPVQRGITSAETIARRENFERVRKNGRKP